MIIPEDIGQQPEIQKNEIPSFYANKRIIGISTIIQELANNYLNENAIWSYYARDQLMIYSNSKELRKADMDEIQRWILSLLKPKERPTTRALKHTENREKTSILCHPNVETGRRGKSFRGVNKVEALIRRKYPLKYDASSDRKT
ncbi:hypothetical protein H5410_001334 [Solanum commersonii]|uniref:Uncharacterized protein n=1 Tax=Solanum commersonii TaxID=4109 RepID=A0A9J6AYX2_SOLCO|nr:hypothetical protein H5410_001334 [Solanum commersonii]